MILDRPHVRPWQMLSAAVLPLLAGCMLHGVDLVQPGALRVQEGGKLEAISFKSTLETYGMAGEQLMYTVSIYDKMARPIRSTDGRFEMTGGQVGARRSILVGTSPQVLPNVTATIPARELHLTADRLPAFAVITVSDGLGQRLAAQRVQIPIDDVMEVTPPLEIPEEEDPVFWFVRGIGPWAGAYWGPVTSADTARTLSDIAEEPPISLRSSQYVWVVSLWPAAGNGTGFRIVCPTEDILNRFLETEAPRFESNGEWTVSMPVQLRIKRVMESQGMVGVYTGPTAPTNTR